MIYDVRLRMRYDYGSPVFGGRQLLRLTPMHVPGVQHVHEARLDSAPPAQERADRRDFFHNTTTGLVLAQQHTAVTFTMTARVERMEQEARLDTAPALADLPAEIAAYHGIGAGAPQHYLSASPRVYRDGAVGEWARDVTSGAPSVLAAVARLNTALHHDMRYDPDATTVETPLSVAFAARHGVCQDFSHIMIAALRDLGIPAGYVSGLLRTQPPPGQPRLEGADAMHAWVGVWCGQDMGWMEFDPTNAVQVGTDHISVAWGRDYSDVAPVKGVLRLSGAQSAAQSVDVVPLG
ncbi:transglutaminase [Ketogulonicigenium robustum]|uniref:Transglutaminase n=1 Tax=Ketogulonicigenium robustum TaxID=92947 RepID=A0A1W6NWX7_9RHOB|nr:transglutaminase family protein [Ketogulonicigenium robustum]ARO13699.1 transglutaminase [Ketogulonicigenium robustum]